MRECKTQKIECAVEFQKINDKLDNVIEVLKGEQGVAKRLVILETYKNEQDGKSKLIAYAVGSGWLITLIVTVIALI